MGDTITLAFGNMERNFILVVTIFILVVRKYSVCLARKARYTKYSSM